MYHPTQPWILGNPIFNPEENAKDTKLASKFLGKFISIGENLRCVQKAVNDIPLY